ncbi:hypothetical protein [Pseudohalocynthiibacter sp. F2068]|jgi:hypothetical protein|uniref:hypothetical protein n=1 Tax=Pseudohalocynthiibacter sp. F2068 TaxID=2926418 RepID=UPI001FF579C3|nr:hypothetical protein [Pseudohalocynthiibacter sp. F2068]MCK0102543.1 hypothetical protein [Pseudohalocynthiibacter sp. F2068]
MNPNIRAVIGSDSTITCEDGLNMVSVAGGSVISRKEFEPGEAFCNTVEAEHQRCAWRSDGTGQGDSSPDYL